MWAERIGRSKVGRGKDERGGMDCCTNLFVEGRVRTCDVAGFVSSDERVDDRLECDRRRKQVAQVLELEPGLGEVGDQPN